MEATFYFGCRIGLINPAFLLPHFETRIPECDGHELLLAHSLDVLECAFIKLSEEPLE